MGANAKNAIMDILKSDEMRAYFEEMLCGQTMEILSLFQGLEETRFNEEILELKKRLAEEQEKSRDLELKNQELEIANGHLEKLYEDKKGDCERALQQKLEGESQITLLEKQNELLVSSITEERKKADNELQLAKMEKTVALSKLEDYENKYACINKAYSNYKSLPESVKQRMGNIFIRDNVYSFIVAVSDWNSIEGIWSFTKRRLIEDENEGLRELVALFVNSFTLFNLIDGSRRYELINPDVGERFDSEKHSIKGIKTDGQIEKVLLSGIYDSTTKKAVFKSVVQIQ